MRWSERQRAMLREMGIPPFWPVEPELEPKPTAVVATEAVATPVPVVAPAPPAPIKPKQPIAVAQVLDALPQARRPDGVESMDWPALREAVAHCRACDLCGSRTQTVFGVGHIEAQWMIVGEAPGEQEDKQGEPFVGRAGQLLDRMLAALDLTRAESTADKQVYIANVLKCRPPANRNPLPPEVAQCEPYLLRQMALVQPRVVLAMGRFAVQSLLKTSEAIGRLRGKVHEVQGVPVIVTYHPAYLLRNPADKALVWDDLCLAREVWAQRGAQSSR
ncbi:MAG TPA: uracil-DNA glycosylase [Aquabacterium sp.]|nr:uracil-DNA glycosylase [Aquabacterium sp.]